MKVKVAETAGFCFGVKVNAQYICSDFIDKMLRMC